jgi:hypothetical protein
MAQRAKGIYLSDVTYGATPNRRGHWMDRLPAIDTDIAAMEMAIKRPVETIATANVNIAQTRRAAATCTHSPPASFKPGEPLSLLFPDGHSARLHYRHVNHAERWQSVDMERAKETYAAAIPGEYTRSKFSLQYYFELRRGANAAAMYPGLNADLSTQPYFVVMEA